MADASKTESKTIFEHQCACFSTRKLARSISQLYDDVLRDSGLRNTQFTLLKIIKKTGSIRLTDMADIAVMDRTTLTRNLKPLISRELISVKQGVDDRRIKMISMTSKGLVLFNDTEPLWIQAQELLASKIGIANFENLLSDLSELSTKIKS